MAKKEQSPETSLQKVSHTYDVTNPQSALDFAKVLADFIEQKKLFTLIQGKKFVNVEGWQFAGSQLGILPMIDGIVCQNSPDSKEIKYQCSCRLIRQSDGALMGIGTAICSNRENAKKNFDEYAILSMAQTRAIGKAYRNLISWLMKDRKSTRLNSSHRT